MTSRNARCRSSESCPASVFPCRCPTSSPGVVLPAASQKVSLGWNSCCVQRTRDWSVDPFGAAKCGFSFLYVTTAGSNFPNTRHTVAYSFCFWNCDLCLTLANSRSCLTEKSESFFEPDRLAFRFSVCNGILSKPLNFNNIWNDGISCKGWTTYF